MCPQSLGPGLPVCSIIPCGISANSYLRPSWWCHSCNKRTWPHHTSQFKYSCHHELTIHSIQTPKSAHLSTSSLYPEITLPIKFCGTMQGLGQKRERDRLTIHRRRRGATSTQAYFPHSSLAICFPFFFSIFHVSSAFILLPWPV